MLFQWHEWNSCCRQQLDCFHWGILPNSINIRVDSRLAPSQWETLHLLSLVGYRPRISKPKFPLGSDQTPPDSGLILGFAPSQWETLLQSNVISHWLGANLESALSIIHREFGVLPDYCQTSDIRPTKSQNLNVSGLVLQFIQSIEARC